MIGWRVVVGGRGFNTFRQEPLGLSAGEECRPVGV